MSTSELYISQLVGKSMLQQKPIMPVQPLQSWATCCTRVGVTNKETLNLLQRCTQKQHCGRSHRSASWRLIFMPVRIHNCAEPTCECKLYCCTTGIVQPWPPCWRGLQAAAASAGWTRPLRTLSGWGQCASNHFVHKVNVCVDLHCRKTMQHQSKGRHKKRLFFSFRCRDSESPDSYVPCSLALFKAHVQSLRKKYSGIVEVSVMFRITTAIEIVMHHEFEKKVKI